MQLNIPIFLPDGRIQFRVDASGGASYVLEATADFSNWTPLLTNAAGAFDFADPVVPGSVRRFYRTRQVP